MQVGCPGTWGLELRTPNPGSKNTPQACSTHNPATSPAHHTHLQPKHPSHWTKSSVEKKLRSEPKRPEHEAHVQVHTYKCNRTLGELGIVLPQSWYSNITIGSNTEHRMLPRQPKYAHQNANKMPMPFIINDLLQSAFTPKHFIISGFLRKVCVCVNITKVYLASILNETQVMSKSINKVRYLQYCLKGFTLLPRFCCGRFAD